MSHRREFRLIGFPRHSFENVHSSNISFLTNFSPLLLLLLLAVALAFHLPPETVRLTTTYSSMESVVVVVVGLLLGERRCMSSLRNLRACMHAEDVCYWREVFGGVE